MGILHPQAQTIPIRQVVFISDIGGSDLKIAQSDGQ